MPPEPITDLYAAAIIADLLALLPPSDAPLIDEATAYVALARREHPEEMERLVQLHRVPPSAVPAPSAH